MAKKPSDFQKLKAKWYKKLEKSGFFDIEQDEQHLKSYSSQFQRERSVLSWEAKEAYYHMCDLMLNEYKFASRLERIIWEYHSNAISFRDIATILNKTRVVTITKDTVYRVVKRIEHRMKLKYLAGYVEKHNEQ